MNTCVRRCRCGGSSCLGWSCYLSHAQGPYCFFCARCVLHRLLAPPPLSSSERKLLPHQRAREVHEMCGTRTREPRGVKEHAHLCVDGWHVETLDIQKWMSGIDSLWTSERCAVHCGVVFQRNYLHHATRSTREPCTDLVPQVPRSPVRPNKLLNKLPPPRSNLAAAGWTCCSYPHLPASTHRRPTVLHVPEHWLDTPEANRHPERRWSEGHCVAGFFRSQIAGPPRKPPRQGNRWSSSPFNCAPACLRLGLGL